MPRQLSLSQCFHGGAVYSIIGADFQGVGRVDEIIDADVLDAWFNPSPLALRTLGDRLAWSLRCSPPVVPYGVERTISDRLGIPVANLVCGAGSSSLIFLALRELLSTASRVLILDPTYGEYAHVVSTVIGCCFDSFDLLPEENYVVDLDRLVSVLTETRYDMVIMVNPNNPSGQIIPGETFQEAIKLIPDETIVWIDEAYIDYAGRSNSLGVFAASRSNVIVCKSLSKVLALSGLRAAYLSANSDLVSRLKLLTPPWSLSLPAQLVLIEAMKDQQYYADCYAQTSAFRNRLASDLASCGFQPRTSCANFILVDYPKHLPVVEDFIALCSEQNLLLRNVRSMGKQTSEHSFRVAVKDALTNKRIAEILRRVKTACEDQ